MKCFLSPKTLKPLSRFISKSVKRSPLYIFVSQVASASGLHEYQPIHEAFELTWRKYDYGNHYKSVVSRVKVPVLTSEEQNYQQIESLGGIEVTKKAQKLSEVVSTSDDVIKACDDISENLKKTLPPDTKPEIMKRVSNQLKSNIRRGYGLRMEEKFVKKEDIKDNNAVFMKKLLGIIKDLQWGIGGRSDGFRNGQLVEIKNRQQKIFDPLPLYDMIQFQCYLKLFNLKEGTLIQQLIKQKDVVQENIITLDEDFWNKTVIPSLNKFVSAFNYFLDEKDAQDYFITGKHDDKQKIVEELMKSIQDNVA